MVVCTLHLIALRSDTSIPSFLSRLQEKGITPVFQAKPLRWMILPLHQSSGQLLGRNKRWDLLLGLRAEQRVPESLANETIEASWVAACGVSSSALAGYGERNAKLLDTRYQVPKASNLAVAEGSAQNLELSPELRDWIDALPVSLQERPISMLNLLAFTPGKEDQYKKYGTEFSSKVGADYGGAVKVVGRVIEGAELDDARRQGWDEVAFVHYPSLRHFAAMLQSKAYQAVNRQYRLGALRDTFILCVVEIGDEGHMLGHGKGEKL